MRFILQKRYLAIQITLRERHSSSLLSQDTGRRRKKNRKITRPRHSDAPISTYISLEGKTKKGCFVLSFPLLILSEKNDTTSQQRCRSLLGFSLCPLSHPRARAYSLFNLVNTALPSVCFFV